MLRTLVSPLLLALLAPSGKSSALGWHSRNIQLERLVLVHQRQCLVDVGGVGVGAALGVIVGHILLQLGVELGITVVQEQVSQILLLDWIDDLLLLILGEAIIIPHLELSCLGLQ